MKSEVNVLLSGDDIKWVLKRLKSGVENINFLCALDWKLFISFFECFSQVFECQNSTKFLKIN